MSVGERKNYQSYTQPTDDKEVVHIPVEIGKLKHVGMNQQSDTLFLYFTVLTGMLPMLIGAAGFAWPSPVIPRLVSNNTNINPLNKPITTIELSSMVGLPALTGLIGSLISAPLSDRIGRKKFAQMMVPAMFICSLIIAYSTKAVCIIITRCINAIPLCAMTIIMQVYMSEVCEDRNRAKHGCLLYLLSILGTIYTFVLGPLLSVRNLTLITNFLLLLFLVLSFFIPESPVFSLSKGRDEDCMNALRKLRSNKSQKEIALDFHKIKKTLELKFQIKRLGFISLFKAKESRIGLLLIFIPGVLHCFSVMPILIPFLGPVFENIVAGLSGDNIAILSAVTKFCIFGVTSFVVERTGRKPLLICSSIGCCISLIVLGLSFYLKHIRSVLASQLNWLPLVAFLVYLVSYSMGIGVVPHSLPGEMFTLELRAAAYSFIMISISMAVFFLSSAFPIVAEMTGVYVCFWAFAFNCFVGGILIYILLPETRGKSIIEIQEILKNYKFSWKQT